MSRITILVLTVAVAGAASSAAAATIQINFTDNNAASTAQIGSSGYWNVVDGEAAPSANVANLKNSINGDTNVALTWGSFAGFQNNGRAEGGTGTAGSAADGLSTWTAASVTADPNSGVTYTADGKYFPWAVIRTFSADNTDSGRDGLMRLTFSSDTQLTYSFWVMTSYDHNNPTNNPGLFNVGGTYGSGTFTGGTTLTLNASAVQQVGDTLLDSNETSPGSVKYAVGRVGTSFTSTYNAVSGKYELTFQAGRGNTGSVYLNGLIVDVIPEPGSLALVTAASLLMLPRRRRA
jgi:hypothetical protein